MSIRLGFFFILVLGLAIAPVPAAAARLVVDAPGERCFSIAMPNGWMASSPTVLAPEDDPNLPLIVSFFPDVETQVWLGVWHAPLLTSLDDARERLNDLDGFVLEAPTIKAASDDPIAGFPAFRQIGTATSDGQQVTYGIFGFAYAPDAVGVGLYIGEQGAWTDYAATVEAALASIRVEDAACASD